MKRTVLLLTVLAVAGSAGAQTLRFEDVVRNLRNPDAKTRLASVQLLREAKYPEAIAPLAPLVMDPVEDIQLEAIAAELSLFLGQDIKSKRMVGFVLEKRTASIAEAAFDLGPAVVWPRAVPPELVSSLLAAMNDDNERVRQEGVYALGVIARPPLAPSAVQPLVKALDHYDPSVRAAAARVIGRLRVVEAGDALIKAVNDSHEDVRHAAMRALGEIRDARAVTALTEQLNYYEKGDGAAAALDALARIGSPASVPVFKARLTDDDENLRRAAAEGLGRAGDRSAIDDLQRGAMTDDSAMVRLAMAFALQRLGFENYTARIADALLNADVARQAEGALVELGPSIAPQLYPRLQESDPAMRRAIAEVLGVIGGPGALPSLEAAAKDQDAGAAMAAKRAIARINARA